jgi:copper transport protein
MSRATVPLVVGWAGWLDRTGMSRQHRGMRRLALLLLSLVAVAALPASALAHAALLSESPARQTAVDVSPTVVTLSFSETVQLLDGADMEVVADNGAPQSSGPGRVSPRDARRLEIPLRRDLDDGTYTVRYKIVSADAHIITGVYAFAVGPGPVGPPFLTGSGNAGPSPTSGWGVSARFFELVGLGGLLGLIGFRWLVWGPAMARSDGSSHEHETVLTWNRDLFWVVFGAMAVGAMVAEGYLLVTYSASALGAGVLDTLGNTTGIGDVLASTRFGSLVQLRGALLFAVFALGAWQFLSEFGSAAKPKAATATGRWIPAALMSVLVIVVLYGISSQGHASQAPLAPLQVAADLVHLSAAAIWIAGLAMTLITLWRLPRIAEETGPALAAAVLARFSRVALIAVGAVIATGTVRAIGQLSDPAQLWDTSYGLSIIYKIGLLVPITLLALRSRRVTNALSHMPRPSHAALAMVRRSAQIELVLSLVIVVVAALLVAQVPGRI